MNKYIDKVTVFILCAVFYAQTHMTFYLVVPIICVIIVSAAMSYIGDDRAALAAALLFFLLSLFFPDLVYFLPVICYDLFNSRFKPAAALAFIPFGLGFDRLTLTSGLFILLFAGLSWLMGLRTVTVEKIKGEYISLRDSTKEFSLLLESKNKELMEKQDYEVNLATLNERNRIARDIHDSVGHLLSNAILQTGAMLAVCRDGDMKERLGLLKETLTAGMDSVRNSIHDLYDESIELYTEIRRLTDRFDFCEIALEYDMDGSPPVQVTYAFVFVVKEALSNIIRHSDARRVTVTLREHPALYQLIVRDNGSKKEAVGGGIGLRNIAERIESLGGIVNIGYDGGFTVFVSVPKNQGGAA